ncbi:hypothetical protein [Methylobacterium aquaticum]|uniref:Calcineurin-like phosphoesterase domain-containing protein n=1 Tax=Methylobacterium aquaticum TaxID=270351 RepID=A0A0C6FQ27_9HYPH|nr:hypothetical protein [Methylobacterium aquaticum]BAQ50398.1 conserved hypothetical protein [Methylobacterium aquaticum]
MATRINKKKAKAEIAAVEAHLRAGAPALPTGHGARDPLAVTLAARDLGVDLSSLRRRIGSPLVKGTHARDHRLSVDWSLAAVGRTAAEVVAMAERGELGTDPVMPGFAIRQVATQRGADGETEREWIKQGRAPGPAAPLPAGHVVKGVSRLVDGEGRTLAEWVKTREGLTPADMVAAIREAFADIGPGAAPVPQPPALRDDLLTLIPAGDWHIGMFAWGAETGGPNWDLKLAERVIGRAVEDVIARAPASAHAVILGGGDLLHSDTQENRTARSGNALQVDGRYQKVLMTAARLMVRTVDAALCRHGHVTVRVLPGNHDEHASVAIAYFLLAWYRAEPRVTVDVDPSLFWWHRFGAVMLGATHGHSVKIGEMPAIMAHRRAVDWGLTRHRYVHGFHLHHHAKFATEGAGVICEIHQSPVPQDAWHAGAGFLSGRSLQAITYHRRFGEVSRARVALLDGEAESEAA